MSTGENLLRSHGLRITKPRLAVLDVLTDAQRRTLHEILSVVVGERQ